MDQLNAYRAFSHRRCYALDRPGAHVAGGEYARTTRLQQVRSSRELPAGGVEVINAQRIASLDETFVVQDEIIGREARRRLRADEDEQMRRFQTAGLAS